METFDLNRDLKKCCESSCLYTSIIFNRKLKQHKRYKFEDFFRHIGQFPDTIGRRKFIYALLDRCNFTRECPLCRESHLDVLQHTLHECPKAQQHRLILKLKLNLYNIPVNIDLTNKSDLFACAVRKRLYRKVLCEFLAKVGE